MAIRMKEWGLLAYPRQGVHLPVNALNDWGRSGRLYGQGVASAVEESVGLLDAMNRVRLAGDMADISGKLDEIGKETARELLELPVRDWEYSWQQAYTPRVQEMLSQFHGETREQALRMSRERSEGYSLEGQRQLELQRIHHARGEWQKQVDDAVQRGDADAASLWVEQGRDVFVPEKQMQAQLENARNQSLQNRWQLQLQSAPHEALAAWQSEEAEKPASEREYRAVETAVQQTRSNLFHALAVQLVADVEGGREPGVAELEQAVSSGVLPRESLVDWQKPRRAMNPAEACDWLRRIDERSSDADTSLSVAVALAPIPMPQRQQLMKRLNATAALPARQRIAVSRTLRSLYNEGAFGNPGDSESLRCLGRLQEEALQRQTTGQEKEVREWLESLAEKDDEWLCFENK